MIAAIMRAQPMPLFKLSALSLALSPVAHIFLHSTTGQSIYILQQQGNLKSDAWAGQKNLLEHRISWLRFYKFPGGGHTMPTLLGSEHPINSLHR